MKQDEYDSRFFDEDGNFVKAQWDIDKENEEKKRLRKEEKLEKRKIKKEIDRRTRIDQRRAEYERKHQEELERRKKREEMMALPDWIKKMPAVPLDAPPEDGNMSKMMYKIRGANAIPEEELRRRKINLKKKKLTIENYKKIHRSFSYENNTGQVAIISLSTDIGSSMITRALSYAMKESRGDLGSVFSIDLARRGSDLGKWFDTPSKKVMTVRNVVNRIHDRTIDGLTPQEVIPIADITKKEHFLLNRDQKEYRIEMEMEDTISLYEFMDSSSGVVFYDCDYKNLEVIVPLMALCETVIFLIPSSNHAAALLAGIFEDVDDFFSTEEIEEIKDKSIVLMSGNVPAMGKSSAVNKMSHATKKSAEISGINPNKTYVVPFDRELKEAPIKWSKLNFSTKNVFREICSSIIDLVIGEEDEY